MTLLCIGDSNTWGFDPRSFLGSRYPAAIRWTERLDGWSVINCGMNGRTVPGDAAPFLSQIQRDAPALVTVMLGTNDLLEGAGAEQCARRMEAFLTALGQTGVRLLLIAPPPMVRGEWVPDEALRAESRKLGSLYRDLAKNMGISFADAGQWGVELSFDGVHFSPRGHAAFASGLTETLLRL